MKSSIIRLCLLALFCVASPAMAEGKSKGGDEFRQTARKYDEKSEKFENKGMPEVAKLYARQAEIKREAAAMGDEGRWDEIDWNEYHANEGRINELMQKKNKYGKKYKKKH